MTIFGLVPSTDGKKLFVIGGEPRGELVGYDSISRRFVPYLSGISAEGVDFSRDGKWVAYVTYPEGTLWRNNIETGERIQLTYPPVTAALPTWNPDGKRIAFMAYEPGRPSKIDIVSIDGGVPQHATTGEQSETDPSWSPDGNMLAFSNPPDQAQGIYVFDLQSKKITSLPGSKGLFAPRWSPNGRYILAQPTNQQKLFIFDVNSKKWSELVALPAGYYIWSRDGQFVYFDVFSTNDPAIYRVRVTDQKIERVVSLKGYRRARGMLLGAWMGLAPDDSPLLLHDVGVQEIYALDWQAP